MFRTVLLTLILVAGGACAEPPPGDTSSDRSEGQPLQLPEDMIGAWIRDSEVYERHGNLTIGRDVLTWGSCTNAPFHVLQAEGRAFIIQVSRSSSCTFDHDADLLVLSPYSYAHADEYTTNLKRNVMGLKVSVCRERPELLDQPHEHVGRCSSSGVFSKSRP